MPRKEAHRAGGFVSPLSKPQVLPPVRMCSMKPNDLLGLRHELETRVRARTGRRVRNLAIELTPGHVTLQGTTATFYDKQLAQHSVREVLPEVDLDNAIVVS